MSSTNTPEIKEILGYEEVHISDFYEDNNEGKVYGVQYGEYSKDSHSFEGHVEVNWFETEDERKTLIMTELTEYININDL